MGEAVGVLVGLGVLVVVTVGDGSGVKVRVSDGSGVEVFWGADDAVQATSEKPRMIKTK